MLPPVATYADVVLWNWKPIFDKERVDTLTNLDIVTTFSGSLDEKWFYLVSVAIEAKGGPLIPLMLRAIEAVHHYDRETVKSCLREILVPESASRLGKAEDLVCSCIAQKQNENS